MFWAMLTDLSFQGLSIRYWCYSGHLSGSVLPVQGGPFEEDLCFEICAFLFSSPQLGSLEEMPEQITFVNRYIPTLSSKGSEAEVLKTGDTNVLFLSPCLNSFYPWLLESYPLSPSEALPPTPHAQLFHQGNFFRSLIIKMSIISCKNLWLLTVKGCPSFMHSQCSAQISVIE